MSPQKDTLADAYTLLHRGILALADIEHSGIRIDMEYLNGTMTSMHAQLEKSAKEIRNFPEYALWRKRFGIKTKIGSGEQLAVVLYDLLGHECKTFTDTGSRKVDEIALQAIGTPFTKKLLERAKMSKMYGTYLKGILRETDEKGFCHPVFNLHTTLTYRSSADTPNFQNMPIRNPVMGKVIRRCFIPRPGHVITEHDYSGVEVRVAACYHKDPTMLSYILDESKDMHRDMGAQIYKLAAEWLKSSGKMGKDIRAVAKNKFVFPQFYGSWYIACARDMWEEIKTRNLKGPDGGSLYAYLKSKGITELGDCDPAKDPRPGTFEKHMKEVENDFWNNRFKVYGKWKRRWFDGYVEDGGFKTLTGFQINGIMAKNDVINYPVQGAAFHCLLWSVTRINAILNKRRMRSRIVGQIHDSCVGDIHIPELTEYMDIVQKVMTVDIRKRFPWLIVPLAIEADVTPPNGSWADKQETHYKDGIYTVSMKDGIDAAGQEIRNKYSFDDPIKFTEFLRTRHTDGRKTA